MDACYIYLHSERVLDPLDHEVLPHGAELLVNISVINRLIVPFLHQHFKGQLENLLGTHLRRFYLRGESEIRLL